MDVPEDCRYSKDHEWARPDAGRIRVGITAFAQDALGDIVFVSLPAVGATVAAGDVIGEVESTKSVSELYAPVAGEIVAVNEALVEAPERLNQDPYGEGWVCEVSASDPDPTTGLMDAAAYRQLTDG